MAGAFALMRLAISKEKLLNEKFDKSLFKKSTKNTILFGVLLYLLGAAISWIAPLISMCIYLIIPFYFIFFNSNTHLPETKNQ